MLIIYLKGKPLLELSLVVNSTAPTEDMAARIRLPTIIFFLPNLEVKMRETTSYNLLNNVPTIVDQGVLEQISVFYFILFYFFQDDAFQ